MLTPCQSRPGSPLQVHVCGERSYLEKGSRGGGSGLTRGEPGGGGPTASPGSRSPHFRRPGLHSCHKLTAKGTENSPGQNRGDRLVCRPVPPQVRPGSRERTRQSYLLRAAPPPADALSQRVFSLGPVCPPAGRSVCLSLRLSVCLSV